MKYLTAGNRESYTLVARKRYMKRLMYVYTHFHHHHWHFITHHQRVVCVCVGLLGSLVVYVLWSQFRLYSFFVGLCLLNTFLAKAHKGARG